MRARIWRASMSWWRKLRELSEGATGEAESDVLEEFTKSLDNDLNISGAWGAIFDWVRDRNRQIAEKKKK